MSRLTTVFVTTMSACAFAVAALAQSDDQTRQIVVEPQQEPAAQAAPASDATPAEPAAPADATAAAPASDATPAEPAAPAAAPAPVTVAVDDLKPEQVVLVLQKELQRLGCYGGAIDGKWGPQSHIALGAFGHYGKVEGSDLSPSIGWVKHVLDKKDAVCPADYDYRPEPYHRPAYGGRGGYGGYGGGRY